MKKHYTNAKGYTATLLKNIAKDFNRPYSATAFGLTEYIKMPKVSDTYYKRTLKQAIWRMKNQGWVQDAEKNGKKLMKLTKKGVLQSFLYELQGMKSPSKKSWSGTWWLALFDIPESDGGRARYQLRYALKSAGFVSLQKSVYIYPHDISETLTKYLYISGLGKFVRLLHVDRVDDLKDLKRRCGI